MQNPLVWVDHQDVVWYVQQSAPRSLLNKLFEAVQQWQLQRVQKHAEVEVGEVWLQPLSILLESKEDKVWGEALGSSEEESVAATKSEGVGWG